MIPRQEILERARLSGEAVGVIPEDFTQPVDGFYELSTISTEVGGRPRRETVAFKLDGVGPQQISEPRLVKTLTIEEECVPSCTNSSRVCNC